MGDLAAYSGFRGAECPDRQRPDRALLHPEYIASLGYVSGVASSYMCRFKQCKRKWAMQIEAQTLNSSKLHTQHRAHIHAHLEARKTTPAPSTGVVNAVRASQIVEVTVALAASLAKRTLGRGPLRGLK